MGGVGESSELFEPSRTCGAAEGLEKSGEREAQGRGGDFGLNQPSSEGHQAACEGKAVEGAAQSGDRGRGSA